MSITCVLLMLNKSKVYYLDLMIQGVGWGMILDASGNDRVRSLKKRFTLYCDV